MPVGQELEFNHDHLDDLVEPCIEASGHNVEELPAQLFDRRLFLADAVFLPRAAEQPTGFRGFKPAT